MLASRNVSLRLTQQGRLWQRSLNAAATSKSKRALNPEQLHGATTSSAKPEAPSGGGSGSESNNLIPFGIAGAVAVGGGAYLFSSRRMGQEETPLVAPANEPSLAIKKSSEKATKEAESTSSEAPQSTTQESGHRVTSIAIPAKMKNTEAPSLPVVAENPIDGNRVSTLGPVKKDDKASETLADASMTQQAIQELTPKSKVTTESQESLVKSHQSLWSSLEEAFLMDLDALTNSQLKTRIVQLASELKDRTKWEAVRLKEFLAMKESETANHYMDLLQKQRSEFESLLAQRLRDQEHELQLKANAALQEKELTIQNLLATALEAQKKEYEEDTKAQEELAKLEITAQVQEEYNRQLEAYKKQAAQALEQKVSALQSLTHKLEKLETALQASGTFQKSSIQAHRLSAAALALAERLESRQPVATELATLKSVAGEEGVIPTALETIPTAAAQSGIPTLAELQAEFDEVYDKCRQAALVPKGRLGIDGQLAGMLFAKIKYPPSPEDPAPENGEPDANAEYVLVRAKKHVSLGQLEQAVEQLDQLAGQVGFTAKDWKQQALDRIAVEKALRVIKMECALLNESMSE